METIIFEAFDKEHEMTIWSAYYLPSGYGHKKIFIELKYGNEYKQFESVTSDMVSIDRISNIDDYTEKKYALYNLVKDNIEWKIEQWLEDLENKFM